MLARLQQLLALVLALATVTWSAAFIHAGRPALAPLGVVLMATGYAAFLGTEFVLLWRSYAAGDTLRPTASQLLRAWAQETWRTPAVFLWRQPFRSRSEADYLPAAAQGRRGVVFVHGFLCNRGIWNPGLAQLRDAGVPFVAVDLEPVFAPIDRYAPIVDAAVRQVEAATGLSPVIVAHSMGGLVVRSWLAGGDRVERFHRIVTVATPHSGTALARFSHFANVRDMRPGGSWLESAGIAASAAFASRVVCFWSHCDNIVFPTRNAILPGAEQRHLSGTPHVQMVYHDAVLAEVLRLVGARREHAT